MDLKALNARNAATLATLRSNSTPPDPNLAPYFGYFDVDLFECPTFVMFTNNDCPRANEILYGRSFEPQSMRIWCRLVPGATGILDIGAHVGVYSLSAAALRSDISIHAFEPNPHAYTRLRVNKMVNAFDNIVEHPFAVGKTEQYVGLSWLKRSTPLIASGALIGEPPPGAPAETAIVPMHKLDGSGMAATLGAKPLVKIDVEGFEIRTVQGMSEVLQLRPDMILETFEDVSCKRINAIVLPLGYRVFLIHEKRGCMTPRPQLEKCDPAGEDFNQLLTTRGDDELRALRLL